MSALCDLIADFLNRQAGHDVGEQELVGSDVDLLRRLLSGVAITYGDSVNALVGVLVAFARRTIEAYVFRQTGGAFGEHFALNVDIKIAGFRQVEIESVFGNRRIGQFCTGQNVKGIDHAIAVAHREFKSLTDNDVAKMFKREPIDKRVVIDVKGILNKTEFYKLGYKYWRL